MAASGSTRPDRSGQASKGETRRGPPEHQQPGAKNTVPPINVGICTAPQREALPGNWWGLLSSEGHMTDIQIAREAAAKAQVSLIVQKMILSGDYDDWPNVQAALNAIRMVRAPE